MVCRDCPKRESCREICSSLKRLLPSMEKGRFNYGRLSSKRLEELLRRRWVTQVVLDWRHILSGRQRQVVDMYYNEGLTHDEIATRLGIAQKNVTTYMHRAYRKIVSAARNNLRRDTDNTDYRQTDAYPNWSPATERRRD